MSLLEQSGTFFALRTPPNHDYYLPMPMQSIPDGGAGMQQRSLATPLQEALGYR